ncbi:TPA: malonate decarboxylase subunit epsilon [Legionella pneumophila]|nr:malonate decarboxylase subunit epsilon [Legionella pneumophila]HAT1923658.1 malonate decarboxylase subunit epsilon [Legionella pneumophila]HAT7769626.1 malonate decarboxylase subunit epsilon [Legionella pneumophila]HAU1638992.1 malonate decarboxylase subunit epsilon [Legionella pneumophila]HAU1684390.1 malonate decarboxylase subunit epsilon [Legionella pneumophila]
MKLLFIFAGQGYHANSLFDIFRTDKKAMNLLKIMSSAAEIDFLQNDLEITNPHSVQSIIGAYQLTLFSRLLPHFTNHQVDLAGYSLGEISAFLGSINASPQDSFKLFRYRTQLMTSIVDKNIIEEYDLLSVVGQFILEEIQPVIAKHNCYIAIINSTQHVVIGGKISDLTKLITALSQYPVRHAKFLGVYLPSHTDFYSDKSKQFQQFLDENYGFYSLKYPVISPLELNKIYDARQERVLLGQELCTTLQWHRVCSLIGEYQYNLIIDLGPGDSMTTILTKANAESLNIPLITASHYNSLKGLCNAITSLTSSYQ